VKREQIAVEVAQIIRHVLELPELAITDDTSAENIEAWDSFNQVNIVVAVEAKFGIKFRTAEMESLRNVGSLLTLVAEKLQRKA
jgi:acyl carrier protein